PGAQAVPVADRPERALGRCPGVDDLRPLDAALLVGQVDGLVVLAAPEADASRLELGLREAVALAAGVVEGPLPGDEPDDALPEGAGPQDDRLQHALGPDALGELGEGVLVERLARLERARVDPVEADRPHLGLHRVAGG